MKEISGYKIVRNEHPTCSDCVQCSQYEKQEQCPTDCVDGCYYVKETANKKTKIKNNKIRFRLEVWETTVIFQILEMDERFRSTLKNICFNTPYLNIQSTRNINMGYAYIHLRGKMSDHDLSVASIFFSTKGGALEYKEKVIKSLKYWAENWKGFKEYKKYESDDINQNIYEF